MKADVCACSRVPISRGYERTVGGAIYSNLDVRHRRRLVRRDDVGPSQSDHQVGTLRLDDGLRRPVADAHVARKFPG